MAPPFQEYFKLVSHLYFSFIQGKSRGIVVAASCKFMFNDIMWSEIGGKKGARDLIQIFDEVHIIQ